MIDVIDLNKVFDNGFEALKSVNFSIEQGDLVCLLGPSGCGKSTILNMIAGLLQPTGGDIQFKKSSVINTEPKDRNIGFVFQNYALYPHMTVLENIMFPLTVGEKKISKEEAKKVAEEYMQLTNIEELAEKKPGTLSGGQQQRVAITRALVQKPEVLLLDEPLSNLDARLRLKIREEIRRLVKEVGITTIFVTHDQEEALTLSDRIAVFNNGFIEQVGTPPEIYHQSKTEFVCDFIGDINVLTEETVHDILSKNPSVNLEDKKGYIRLEKIRFKRETEEDILLNGTIIDTEFSGVNVRYTIQVSENQIVNVTRIDSQFAIKSVGENVELYITPSDIVQY